MLKRKTKKILINLTLVVISISAAFTYIEIISRKYYLVPPIIRLTPNTPKSSYKLSDNPILGYELKPNFRSLSPNSYEVYSYTNAFGQRDIERTLKKPENKKRIIVLGDSVVAGNGISDLNNTITRNLEKILSPSTIEVLNFGLGGYATKGEIELLKTKAVKFNPDMVILLYVDNDVIEINDQIEHYVKGKLNIYQKLYTSSYVVRYICNILHINPRTDIFKNHYKAVGKDTIGKSIEIFKNLAKEYNFEPCIMLWPTFYKKEFITRTNLMDHVITAAKSNKIPLFDLKPYMEKHLSIRHGQNFLKFLTTGDTMHPNEEGSFVAAKAIKSIIKEHFADLFAK